MTEYALTDADGTVRWRGTIDPPPGGGSQPGAVRVLKYEFDFSQAVALADGVTVWTPEADDVLLNAWFEQVLWTADGDEIPKADIGVITAGAWALARGFSQGLFVSVIGNPVVLSDADWVPDPSYDAYSSSTVTTDLQQASLISVTAPGTGAFPVTTRMRTADPLKLVVSGDGNPGGNAFDGSAGSSTLYIVVSTPSTTP